MSPIYKREILNQLINFFWTMLCFAPLMVFWIKIGITLHFYLFIASAFIFGLLPENVINKLMLSSNKRFYEKLGVKLVRKFVQNGDVVKKVTKKQNRSIINGSIQARRYLKNIAMYERFHWICFIFFLFTMIESLLTGYLKLGLTILAANILYNLSSILLQQYNKIRIKKIVG